METGPVRRGGHEPIAQINITPMVDVMLVLLIIFMVTASMAQQGINVNLPKANAPALTKTENVITVAIDKNLTVYVNNKVVDKDKLTATLQSIFSGRTDKSVFLKADRAVAYGDFISVVARIKAAGIQQLGMMTDPPGPAAQPGQ